MSSQLGLMERWDIQQWVGGNPRILEEGLLIIAEEFADFDRTRERLDLLAVDRAGDLVVIELKRDDSGTDVHGQAIKYASYLEVLQLRKSYVCSPATRRCPRRRPQQSSTIIPVPGKKAVSHPYGSTR